VGEVADVETDHGEPRDLGRLPLRQEPLGDPTLIEDLDGPCVQATCAQAGEVLVGSPLDDGDVDAAQRQLAGQHQPRRATSGDHHRVLGHRHTPCRLGRQLAARDAGGTFWLRRRTLSGS
jgi:hypothetical protein